MGARSSDRERIAQYDDVLPKKETYSLSGRERGKKGERRSWAPFFRSKDTVCIHDGVGGGVSVSDLLFTRSTNGGDHAHYSIYWRFNYGTFFLLSFQCLFCQFQIKVCETRRFCDCYFHFA